MSSLNPAGVRARRALLDSRLSDQHAPPTTPAAVEGKVSKFPVEKKNMLKKVRELITSGINAVIRHIFFD